MVFEMQFINTQTCRPIEGLYVDVWQANATGTYSGVASIDNGNSLLTLEEDSGTGGKKMTGGIVNESWLRGVQQTGQNGVVRFKTIIPGWYDGRATHIHLLAHKPSSIHRLPNNTLISTSSSDHSIRASHVGQLFFDAGLLNLVAKTHPYHENPQRRIQNEDDAVLMLEGDVSDPMLQYVMMGSRIEDGIFGWISIGIDPAVDVEVKSAASWFGNWGQMWKKLWF
ncbi:hypothetical protein CCHL11_06774 [Colletotrichum chlorophyti]|uniref:Intradiol ring-cleavage dioxygenases domain-containing protein n=1 Tax=Colletotrichum chlorophyti TaxID=708187 RepID=A0A1Q8RZ22_9PEZI|nr:hypothetical protein CCHL11_06774 [Colletotrichum chlorophyti]